MKGDFSKWGISAADNDSGVLHQQGRVLLDTDWNAAQQIDALWRETAGGDLVGDGLVAVPAAAADSFALLTAKATAAGVELTLAPGRAWVDGLLLRHDGAGALHATYLQPPLQNPPADVTTIAAGVRDAVILETWDEAVSAFQHPRELLEPALGGPDTTERVRRFLALRLLRLADGQDCGGLDLVDDVAAKGKLTVTPSPTAVIPGPCPVPDSGGYSGFEHYLYRIEIAEPKAGAARFKWSQYNGGLVGRGTYAPIDASSGTVTVTANDAMIDQCGLDTFYFEALAFDPADGHWRIALRADATRSANGTLALTNVDGSWPAPAGDSAFFRLWNGIARIADFPTGLPLANELKDGIRLAFDAPATGNYVPGDYWTFPARAAGVAFDPSVWPTGAPPQGVHVHRAPLGVLHWTGAPTVTLSGDDIHDCREVFLPLARVRGCCTVTVGDGRHSFGRFDSIQKAVDALPAQGGTVCVLAGTYEESVRIRGRVDVRIHGCGPRTRVLAGKNDKGDPLPAFTILDSTGIALDAMAIESGPRSAVQIQNARHVDVRDCLIRMRDTATVWHAIHVRGDDVCIEHNVVEILAPDQVKFPQAHVVPPKLGEPGAPAGVRTPEDPVYLAEETRGGIQLAGGCDRVRIASNRIRGGLWNGITLGSLIEIGGHPDRDLPDAPLPPDRCQPCEPPDLGDPDDPNGDRPRYASAGDLYDIEILDNRITDAGINGIGMVRYFDLTRGGDMIGVHGLRIAGNRITRCLRREPARTAATTALLIGYGGISLAHASDLRIVDNEIVGNGTRHTAPVCGVFALVVQGLQLDGNRILHNGPRDGTPVKGIAPGVRGGVHVWLLLPLLEAPAFASLGHAEPQTHAAAAAVRFAPRSGGSTATVRDNLIVAPVGRTLTAFALGPVTVARNRLLTQGTTGEGLDLLAATVLLGDLGIGNDWTLGLLLVLVLATAGQGGYGHDLDLCQYARLLGLADYSHEPPTLWPPLSRRWATGKLLISENQITLDVADDPAGVGLSSVLALSLDDVAIADNQIEIASTEQFYFYATAAFGGSVRVCDNRFAETWMRAAFSAVSVGLMNTTTDNQATHCLRATALLPRMRMFKDNLSLIEAFCENACHSPLDR